MSDSGLVFLFFWVVWPVFFFSCGNGKKAHNFSLEKEKYSYHIIIDGGRDENKTNRKRIF